jgi:hypothetical protein
MNKNFPGNYLRSITRERSKDSGAAFVLILLLAGLWTRDVLYFKIAAGGLLLNMIFPMLFYPFAVVWFGLSGILGAFMSKILLLFIYLVVVMPVALLRRLMGKDPFLIRGFKQGSASVMHSRDQVYRESDMERPF